MAGDEGREPHVECRNWKAAGRLSGGEGRKPGADLSRRAKPAGASERTPPEGETEGPRKRLRPKGMNRRTRVRTKARRRPENRQAVRSCRFRPDVLEKARAGDQFEAGPKARRKPSQRQRRRAGAGDESRMQVPKGRPQG
jgi:hypothetical protein